MNFCDYVRELSNAYDLWMFDERTYLEYDAFICILARTSYEDLPIEEKEVVDCLFVGDKEAFHDSMGENRYYLEAGITALERSLDMSFFKIMSAIHDGLLSSEQMNQIRPQFLRRLSESFQTGKEFLDFAKNCDTIEAFNKWFNDHTIKGVITYD